MQPLTLRLRADLTLAAFEEVAWHRRPVALDDEALAAMAGARSAFLDLIEHEPEVVVYGVTSGYGFRAKYRFTAEERAAHARLRSHATATAFGAPLPERVARGIVLARLANFLEGHSAVSPRVALAVAAMLDGRALPEVPAEGVGSPGEIQPLAHLLGPVVDAVDLGEKDLLSLLNGSPCASALIADAALAARRRVAIATAVLALAAEALRAPLDAYDPALDDLFEDPDEAAALQDLRRLLAGGGAERRPYQAPVSFRIVPRVLGQARRAVAGAAEAARISLRAVSDNPIYLMPDPGHPRGRVLSNGGFHNARAAPAMDALGGAFADLALLADRQVTKLLDGNVSGLPNQLITGDGRALDGTFLGCLGMTALAWAEQARHAARLTLLPGSEGGGFGQNDVAAVAFPAWRQQAEAGRCLGAGLACLAVVASQAFFITGREAPPGLAPL
ncbi:MAG TPA: aromatic amino acid lyase, partial [Geminicoccaceae bacterium]